MVRPVTQAHVDGLVPAASLSAEGKLRRAGTALWGTSFRDEGKHGEPQDRQQGERSLHGRGGESVEVVRNHADGTRGGLAAVPRREARRRVTRASDSSARYDGGAIFGQPQERKSDRRVGRHGSRRDGKVGVKVRRVSHAHGYVSAGAPVVGTSRAAAPMASKAEEGSGGASHRGSDRGSPPEVAPEDGSGRRETVGSRESATIQGPGMASHVRGPAASGR